LIFVNRQWQIATLIVIWQRRFEHPGGPKPSSNPDSLQSPILTLSLLAADDHVTLSPMMAQSSTFPKASSVGSNQGDQTSSGNKIKSKMSPKIVAQNVAQKCSPNCRPKFRS
jgi:hypothetical protein